MVKRKKPKINKEKLIAENFKLIAAHLRLLEMHCEIAFPTPEQANTQGTVRDSLRSIAQAMVAIAEAIEIK